MNRRLSFACIIALSSASALALAQVYPNKPIRIVVPYPPGGPIDMTTRPLAQKLSDVMGNPVVVDNRAGANNAADSLAESPLAGSGVSAPVG